MNLQEMVAKILGLESLFDEMRAEVQSLRKENDQLRAGVLLGNALRTPQKPTFDEARFAVRSSPDDFSPKFTESHFETDAPPTFDRRIGVMEQAMDRAGLDMTERQKVRDAMR